MLAPLSWLRDYVDIDVTPQELEEKMDVLKAALADGSREAIRAAMHAVVPTFHEPEEVNNTQGAEVELPEEQQKVLI